MTGETRTGAVTGTSRRPTNSQASTTPSSETAVTISATVERRDDVLGLGSGSPNTGSSQSASGNSETSRKPAATEPTASTIIGTVMTGGDSCGCTPSSQRGRPKKVISISRVM